MCIYIYACDIHVYIYIHTHRLHQGPANIGTKEFAATAFFQRSATWPKLQRVPAADWPQMTKKSKLLRSLSAMYMAFGKNPLPLVGPCFADGMKVPRPLETSLPEQVNEVDGKERLVSWPSLEYAVVET